MKILLGSQSYEARSEGSTGQRLVNMYAEPNPEGSKYPFTLYHTPGLTEWADLGTGTTIFGMQVMDDNLYAVSNNTVFKISSSGTVSTVGTITGTQGRVDLSNNGTQMTIITPDGDGFVATSSAVNEITDGDFPTASSTAFLDGYTIVSKSGTGQFNISALLDSTSWDALDFATAEETPDNLVRVFAFNSALWLFGKSSFEVFYNSGNADFPFEQISGSANTRRGLLAKFSVAQEDNGLFFLGDDRILYRINGYNPQRISTHAMEHALQGYTTLDDAFGFIYTIEGHKFYIITFPTENKTWAYDIATGKIHERTSLEGNNPKRWFANCHAEFAGLNLVGHRSNGKIYKLDMENYTEDGTTIERIIQGSVQWQDGKRITYDRVRLDVDAGVGLTTGQGSDPQVMMRYSDDGTKTWSNEKWRSIGKIGEYKDRAIWRRMGTARERIFEWRLTDPVPWKVTGAYANGRIGRE